MNATLLDATLRPARASDLAPVCALLQANGLPPYDLTAGHMRRFVVLDAEGTLVGAVGLEGEGRSALLRSLVVAESLRGRGWGHRLVARVEAAARQEGVTALYLLTTTAEAFFKALGYRSVERDDVPAALRALPEFSSICPSSAACLVRRLDPVAVSVA